MTAQFQSHLGSILPHSFCFTYPPAPRFNPTLVRFCPTSSPPPAHTSCVSIPPWFDFARVKNLHALFVSTFQSHLGSILPQNVYEAPKLLYRFQSHLGSILPKYAPNRNNQTCSFNPTLVRFCRVADRVQPQDANAFQSHLGSILPRGSNAHVRREIKFQSHLGSILPTTMKYEDALCAAVSIPPWFDFAVCPAIIRQSVRLVSIPPWFDFALKARDKTMGRLTRFNPTLVRFCPRKTSRATIAACHVSIPPWFDFATLSSTCSASIRVCVSIPPWFDFACRVCLVGGRFCGFQSHLGSILPGPGGAVGCV